MANDGNNSKRSPDASDRIPLLSPVGGGLRDEEWGSDPIDRGELWKVGKAGWKGGGVEKG